MHQPGTARDRFFRAAFALVWLLSLTSCAGPEVEPYFDLVDHFEIALVESPAPTEDGLEAVANRNAGHIFLPAGSRVTYAFLTHENSALAFEKLTVRGHGVDVAIVIAADDSASRTLPLEPSPSPSSVDLQLRRAVPIRLTLQVSGNSDTTPGSGALIARPAVHGLVREEAAETLAPPSPVERPNVVIYVVDTLRRDRLGCYGYDRPVSPHIDAFAAEATRYTNSHGQSSWTKPSVASVFTGVWPPSHGAFDWSHHLAEDFETLAERLRAAGYSTAGFVTNVNASKKFGFDQGFDSFWYERRRPATHVNDAIFEWLDDFDGSRPFFFYVHTMEPHAGYHPTEPFRSQFAPTADEMQPWRPRWQWPIEYAPIFSDLYDGEIAQNDVAFGLLLDRLAELDLYDETLIIFLSDHGEEFREHGGWRHNRVLHAETLDMPLIIKFPGQRKGSKSDVPASHVDILPTILDVAELPPFPGAEGQSLVRPRQRPIFSHLDVRKFPTQYSVIDGGWKLIRAPEKRVKLLLFDIASDPGETRNLASDLPVRVAAMEALIDRHIERTGKVEAEDRELSAETERELRALGYLQ